MVTKERQFILNVNLNNYHKTRMGREGDVELLMLFITLLKLSHSIVILEPEMEARNIVRLLRTAELMDFGEKLGLNPDFVPNIIFVSDEWKEFTGSLMQSLFKGSRIQDYVTLIEWCRDDDVIKMVYKYSRVPMSLQTTPGFTELHWYQVIQSLWKQHKTNYFLVKYGKAS